MFVPTCFHVTMDNEFMINTNDKEKNGEEFGRRSCLNIGHPIKFTSTEVVVAE